MMWQRPAQPGFALAAVDGRMLAEAYYYPFPGTSQMPIDSFNKNLWWWYDGDRSIESLRLITATHQPEATR